MKPSRLRLQPHIGWLPVFLFLSSPAHAQHFRGVEAWAAIDASGVVTLHVVTTWSKGHLGGVDPNRFGTTTFTCNEAPHNVAEPTSMKIVDVSGSPVYQWVGDEFTLSETTIGTDLSAPTYDRHFQIFEIPLGSVDSPSSVSLPLGLPYGHYDIIWNDWSRVPGVQNIYDDGVCGLSNGGFGFKVRVDFRGVSKHGPSLDAAFNTTITRGLEYSQNLNVFDRDFDALTYALAPTDPSYASFGPSVQVPGLTLNSFTGLLTIPAASTNSLLDNIAGEPGADYLLKVRISDISGFVSERDVLLDVLDCEDADGDGVCDATDNCPLDANADQQDSDNDGLGDPCDQFFDFGFQGFLSPYAAPPATFRRNRVVPLVWQYTGSDGQVTDSAAANPRVDIYGPVSCGSTTETVIVVEAGGQSGYQYDATTQTWQFGWRAAVTPGCYEIQVTSSQAQPSPRLPIQIR